MELTETETGFEGYTTFDMAGSFVDAARGEVELRIENRTIYNWTRYFDKTGIQVYGSEIRGYTLERRSVRDR